MKQLLRYRKNLRFVFFDFETESLNLSFENNLPWQIAMIKIDSGQEVDSRDYYLKWDRKINVSEGAAKVTGFDLEKYKKIAVDQATVFPEIEEWFGWADYIVGHNILNFDIPLAKEWYKMHNKNWKKLLPKCIDTKCIAQSIKSKIPFDIENDDFLSWQIALSTYHERGVKTNLSQMAKDNEIEFNPSFMHSALYDIRVNEEVFEKLIWQIEI